ncbi:MAG TPA: class I adenylate-forming enzyme family protein, partial [Xanthobacteraceae bacterium]|nr:class I adenylate-forming enzyme family protein [Xanthobacteraceae bacterium]
MRPFDPETIARYARSGQWGAETFFDLFAANAAAGPDAIAIADPPNRPALVAGLSERLSYREALRRIEATAQLLHRSGLRAGDVMLVQMPNIHELIIVYLAAARAGVVVSPVPVQYRHHELSYIVSTLAPKAFCSVARLGETPLIESFRGKTGFDGTIFGVGDGLPAGAIDLRAAWADDGNAGELPEPAGDPNAVFTICWTSGTEGRPKAVPRTHNNWLASAEWTLRSMQLKRGDALLVMFQLVNAAAFGGLMAPWLRTAGMLALHHPFDIEVLLRQLAEEKITYTLVAPALVASILTRAESGDAAVQLHALKAIGTGSAPPDPSLIARFEARFSIPVANVFGSNEGAQLCSAATDVPDPRTRARLFPRDGDEGWTDKRTANGGIYRLVDLETGERITAPGRIGEMRISGPATFPGYFERGTFNRANFDGDGFFSTGDLFELVEGEDGCGYVRFVGRSKEIIVRGGMKI